MYDDVLLFIDGKWRPAQSGATLPVTSPSTGRPIGTVALAGRGDLEDAVNAAERGLVQWSETSPFDRYQTIRDAAGNMRARRERLAWLITEELGRPFAHALQEVDNSANILDWFAEQGRSRFGQIIPGRSLDVRQEVVQLPIGVVAAFTPWNFPLNQAVRKIGPALAVGCAVILKASEETPASVACMVQCFADAALPAGVLNAIFGEPQEISDFLLRQPAVRKISFTGSTRVGRLIASLAGQHLKPVTLELGGHAPVIVTADAAIDEAVTRLVAAKFRNSGQVCTSPTRFLVHRDVYSRFVDRITEATSQIRVGNGHDPETQMGPLVNENRRKAVTQMVANAIEHGAILKAGGCPMAGAGYYFQPTVLSDVPVTARIMNEEPFGPLIAAKPFETLDEAISEANRLPYALAAYAYTGSLETATVLSARVVSGMLSINHQGLGLPETHFGGTKDSGYGSEGGTEAFEGFVTRKLITTLMP